MIARQIEPIIREQIGKYSVLTITGPRQSGKTTLIKNLFADLPYFSFENPDVRKQIERDPRNLFATHGHRMVLDEVQRYPEMLSYIQGIVDEDRDACFVLSGSHNMLMMESVSQTLAGRTAIFYLHPLSYSEISMGVDREFSLDELMWAGGYPRIYDRDLDPKRFYQNYLETYVQRDVRQIKNIGNLGTFARFLGICAGFIGQTINQNTLADAAGISRSTVNSWLSVLETSYVIYQVQPYYKNFKKRIVKSPKLYFRDTGLACSLLRINSAEALQNYYQRGAIFENFVYNEVAKAYYNQGNRPPFYFWRDSNQREIDMILDHGLTLRPIEIKSGTTYRSDYFKHLDWFAEIADVPLDTAAVIYGADNNWEADSGHLISWKNIDRLIK